jgi:hypothetical protein
VRQVTEWDEMEKLWRHTFDNELRMAIGGEPVRKPHLVRVHRTAEMTAVGTEGAQCALGDSGETSC